MPTPNVPKFFSVERKGYLTISSLFTDVMKDMIDNGFTLVKDNSSPPVTVGSSNNYPLVTWKTTLKAKGAAKTWTPGTKLYIAAGTRPLVPGSTAEYRPKPFVQVLSVKLTDGSISSDPTDAGEIYRLSDVGAEYNYPLWNTAPTGEITLEKLTAGVYSASDVKIEIALTNCTTSITADSGQSYLYTGENAPDFFSFTLEAGGDVDPWNGANHPSAVPTRAIEDYEKQPWRIQFNITGPQVVGAYVATGLQLYYEPLIGKVVTSRVLDDDGQIIDNVGAIGAAQIKGQYSDTDLDQAFYNRTIRVGQDPQTFPLSYVLSITNRGFFLGIYEGSWSTVRAGSTNKSNYFNWILVQRPVDRNNGDILIRGKAPVFCVNSVNYKYYKTVVRESDILHPTTGPTLLPGPGNIKVEGSGVYAVTTTGAGAWVVGTDTTAGTNPNKSGTTPAKPKQNTQSNWKATLVAEDETGIIGDATLDLPVGTTIYANVNGYKIGEVTSVVNNTTVLFKERPSDPGTIFEVTGDTPITNRVNWLGASRNYYISLPNQLYLRTRADVHSPDNHAIFNTGNQIALTEDKTYLLSFPHNLTTPRFRYTEELDMIGTTSSDVVMAGQDIQFTTYGELGPRTYRALAPSGELNTGVRLAVLWAPQGPVWVSPGTKTVDNDLGTVTPGDVKNVVMQANPAKADYSDPEFEIYRGTLPKGLVLDQDPDTEAWSINGTVAEADYTEPTKIRFTISAKNVEDSGFALREFYFTYTPADVPGSGAEFTIEVTSGTYAVTVTAAGTNYNTGDTITITGDNLGGATPANDATITVNTVDANGGITGASVTGTGTGTATFTGLTG